MRKFEEPNRDQLLMLATVNLNSVAPVGSALRAIDELVNQLNTSIIESDYDLESCYGANPIHPKTIIKVALYAMHNCRFSLRKMEEDTKFHLGYQWLTGNRVIDHSTIGKFLAKYKLELVDLFSQIVTIGLEHELVDFEVLNIDTVKIRANASYKQFRNISGIEKEQEKLKTRLNELIENVSTASEEEKIIFSRQKKLDKAKTELLKRIEKKSQNLKKKAQEKIEKKERINITDNDCSLIQQANGEINSAYAITVAADSKSDFITYVEVRETLNDPEALIPAIEGSKKTTNNKHKVVNADAGFSSVKNLEKLEEVEQFALIPDRRIEVEEKNATAKGAFDRSKFKYDKKNDKYKCPANNKLDKISEIKTNNGRLQFRYANPKACTKCKYISQCTKSKYRIISRDANERLKEKMRKKLALKKNKEIYKKRAHTIETPFGHIKHNLKYRIFMRRGREKIEMEMVLLSILHNILKINSVMAYGT